MAYPNFRDVDLHVSVELVHLRVELREILQPFVRQLRLVAVVGLFREELLRVEDDVLELLEALARERTVRAVPLKAVDRGLVEGREINNHRLRLEEQVECLRGTDDIAQKHGGLLLVVPDVVADQEQARALEVGGRVLQFRESAPHEAVVVDEGPEVFKRLSYKEYLRFRNQLDQRLVDLIELWVNLERRKLKNGGG